MDCWLTFVGTGGSVPTRQRGMPALLVARGGERLLLDCGEGTQRQLLRAGGLPELDAIAITHFHADHWLGLPGMLKTFDLRGRERPLRVYGPAGLAELLGAMRAVYGRLDYELAIEELEHAQTVERDGWKLAAFAVEHRARALGYALVEDPRPGHFDVARAQQLGVAPGPDFGRLQRGESVDGVSPDEVLGPPRPGRKLVYTGDTAPCETVALAAHEADVLVHEATFADDEAARARQTGHSTAAQAAALAREARVRMLALTHLSTRYGGHELRDEARAVFAQTVVPRDFDTIHVPLPERGEPRLEQAGGRPAPSPEPAAGA